MAADLEEVTKRTKALEERATALEFNKSDKTELSDTLKRTAALESKFGKAAAVAVALGLGGAGIGGLLWRAYNQIEVLKEQTAILETKASELKSNVDSLGQKFESVKKKHH